MRKLLTFVIFIKSATGQKNLNLGMVIAMTDVLRVRKRRIKRAKLMGGDNHAYVRVATCIS